MGWNLIWGSLYFVVLRTWAGRGKGNRVESPSFWSPSLALSSIQTLHSLPHLWICALLFHHTWYSSCVPLCPQPGPRSFSSYFYYFSSYTEHHRYNWLYLNSQRLLVSLGLGSIILSISKMFISAGPAFISMSRHLEFVTCLPSAPQSQQLCYL